VKLVTISAIKRCSVRLYLQSFVEGLWSYLHNLCLLAHSGVQQILCCVFVLFVFALCTLCYSRTFISRQIINSFFHNHRRNQKI
jgi:hypothetical protein